MKSLMSPKLSVAARFLLTELPVAWLDVAAAMSGHFETDEVLPICDFDVAKLAFGPIESELTRRSAG